MTNKKTRFLVEGGIIAAIYAALTLAIYPLSYGALQLRFSEALTVLPVFTPAAIPGLTVGCIIANLAGPMSWIDAIFGALATFLAAVSSYLTRNIRFKNAPILSLFFPVIFNAVIIGLEINLFFLPEGEVFTFMASEQKLFELLRTSEASMSVTFTSVKSGMNLTLIYRE